MSYYFYYYLRYPSLVRNIVQYFAAWLAESLRHNGNTYMGIQYSAAQHSTVQYSTVQYSTETGTRHSKECGSVKYSTGTGTTYSK